MYGPAMCISLLPSLVSANLSLYRFLIVGIACIGQGKDDWEILYALPISVTSGNLEGTNTYTCHKSFEIEAHVTSYESILSIVRVGKKYEHQIHYQGDNCRMSGQ